MATVHVNVLLSFVLLAFTAGVHCRSGDEFMPADPSEVIKTEGGNVKVFQDGAERLNVSDIWNGIDFCGHGAHVFSINYTCFVSVHWPV